VATNGNDHWSGTLAAPNASKTDGPFATVQKAVEASRSWRQSESKPAEASTIAIRQGVWFLPQPLVLQPLD
jgi:hypothetical protein